MCVPCVQESAKLLSVFTAFATCPPLLRCRQGLALPSPGTPRKEEEDHFLGTDAAKTGFLVDYGVFSRANGLLVQQTDRVRNILSRFFIVDAAERGPFKAA